MRYGSEQRRGNFYFIWQVFWETGEGSHTHTQGEGVSVCVYTHIYFNTYTHTHTETNTPSLTIYYNQPSAHHTTAELPRTTQQFLNKYA